MRILIISDLHLDNLFEEPKYRFLKKIIKTADRVIINGDFWDGYLVNFEQFIQSHWKSLFPLLKSKKAVYIYGNHDKKILSDKNRGLFSDIQTHRYKLRLNGKTLVFEHGNRLKPAWDDLFEMVRVPSFVQSTLLFVHRFLLHRFGKRFIRFAFEKFNKELKKKIAKKNNHMYIFGHTHYGEVDPKNHFANSGFILQGFGQYLIIEDGKIQFKEEWYA